MKITNNDFKYKLESMLGTSVSTKGNIQVGISQKLPIKFPLELVHYELNNNHVELHIESAKYKSLSLYLERNLPNNETSKIDKRNYGIFIYMLNRKVKGWNDVVELGNAFIKLRDIVEPKLKQYCEQIADTFDLAMNLGKYYEEKKESLPFHINVIDELHANENAHTRILTQLLKYKESGKHVILASFLRQLPEFNEDKFNIDKSEVYFNIDNIDALIENKGEYAVIIENKIHWAVDQNKQIERYVTIEIDKGVPSDNIWVVYLTRDGSKKVEDYSFTEETKKILGEKRFVEMDYYHNILPWLKETILPNCRLKEEWLVSAIKQYIDHLEGLFDIRESKKGFLKDMQEHIFEEIGCKKEMSQSEVFSRFYKFSYKLEELHNIVSNLKQVLINSTIERFYEISMKILKQMCPNDKITFNNVIRGQDGYFQILFMKWPPEVHFEWIPLNDEDLFMGKSYTLVLHVEKDDFRKLFKIIISESDFNKIAKEIGLKIYDKSTYYKNVFITNNSISDMSDEDLETFLQKIYKDVYKIQEFVSENILK